MTLPLPDFPRPDLPESHPENYPTLRIRIFRRLGLPDDGGLWLSDAIDSDVLRGYHGIVTEDDADRILIEFASLADAVSWAELVTDSGRDRSTIAFAETPASPYAPVTIQVTLH
jgi:hypothetical protein